MDVPELVAATARLKGMIGLRSEPLAFFYSDREPDGWRPPEGKWSCMVGALARAQRGGIVYFDKEHYGCGGCGVYLGFCEPAENLTYFVSTGIPGKLEGEHYKKSPELVEAAMRQNDVRPAPAKYAIFKQVAVLEEDEQPDVILCFANGDELAGLVFLAGYAREEDAAIVPFSSGCGSIVARPLCEGRRPLPRAVLGMFDPSARPCVRADELTFAAPVALWEEMLHNAAESFLKTPTWAKVRARITGEATAES
ncbi:MAG TPA: DUF169 domain-containing protein [Armatimonadetes bacterium]|nr:DUF169 domain-containing protein [Armatimonadota bacterium]